MIKLPGLIDPHVHLRDPGQTEKEDFYTGTAAALAGGYTTLIDMPNNLEPIFSEQRLKNKIAEASKKIVCDVGFHFGSVGNNYTEFPKVADSVLGLKIYLNQTTGGFILDDHKLENIFASWSESLPILFHAEEHTFDSVLTILQKHPRRIHLCHLSTQYELEKVMEAKHQGFQVTCGVTPHHLFLTDHDEKHLGPFGRMRPPLKSKHDVAFLWNHIAAIDIIESDHAPHTLEEKQSPDVPNGVPGLETTLPLLLTAVADERLTMDDVVRLCHENPSKIFGIKRDDETYSEIDLTESYEIQASSMHSKAKWTPFAGMRVKGKVKSVYLRGKKVFEDNSVLALPGSGTIVRPQ
jgi:dihydroorotase-like cyclic amidohydrolase